MATNDYVPYAPGYVDNEGPKVVTSRFAHEDSYTLARSEATGGYSALRAVLQMAPADAAEQVKEAVLLGRGGAGFPAGIKWGFMPRSGLATSWSTATSRSPAPTRTACSWSATPTS